MKYNKSTYNLLNLIIVSCWSICFLFLTSCLENKDTDLQPDMYETEIKISAEIATQLYSRTYQESGDVVTGDYYISYIPDAKNSYEIGTVKFGTESQNPQIGIVSLNNNKPFKWSEIGGGAVPFFYLDNVKANPNPEKIDNDPAIVTFDNEYNPYKAALFDMKEGSNDLLWGGLQVSRNTTSTLNFDLHHNMSRVRIQITVDKTNDQENGDLVLDGATVEISNINLNPISFNRLDGTLLLNPSTDSESLGNLIFKDSQTDWAAKLPDPEETNKTTYITPDCVIPPQGLLDDQDRPHLIITLENGTQYSGILPHAMEIQPSGEGGTPYPVALYFLKEHILTIRTIITEDPPTLSFMPVKVVDWVDKGDFTLEGHQSGIYAASEFYKLIEYYEVNNEYQLVRYGRLINNTAEGEPENMIWNFDFFNSVVLDYDEIHGKMIPDKNVNGKITKDFIFSFNNYGISVKKGTENKSVTPAQLRGIVTGSSTNPF